MDTKYIEENGIIWEIHKPAEIGIKSNCGCCATIAAWLNYFLQGLYENTGYFSFVRPNGSGHVFNYIQYRGWYYLIDLTPYALGGQGRVVENGSKLDYIRAKNITGLLLKCSDLSIYAKYYNRIQNYAGYNFLYFKNSSKYVYPISIKKMEEKIIVIYPVTDKIECILPDNSKKLDFKFQEGPRVDVEWRE